MNKRQRKKLKKRDYKTYMMIEGEKEGSIDMIYCHLRYGKKIVKVLRFMNVKVMSSQIITSCDDSINKEISFTSNPYITKGE